MIEKMLNSVLKMISATAIAKISDGQVFCEWSNESQGDISSLRRHIKGFLANKVYLREDVEVVGSDKYYLHFIKEQSCVYVCLYSKGFEKRLAKGFLLQLKTSFEEVR